MSRRYAALAALAVLVVLGAATPVLAAVDTSAPLDVETTTTNETYSYRTLADGGDRYPNLHDSWRPIEDRPAASWVRYYPSGGWVDTSEGSTDWQYLSPSDTVKRNFVDLTVMDLGEEPVDQWTLTVVYWEDSTREVHNSRTNTTTTERYAANQTVERIHIDAGSASSLPRVPLRAHYDGPVRVTMWLETSEETARWTFTHRSLKSAQASSTSTAGADAMKVGKVVGIGAVLAVIAYALGRVFNRRAIVGPMKGSMWWLLVLGGGQAFVLLAGWDFLANTLAVHPELLAGELLLVGLVQGIESKGREVCYSAAFLRPDVTPVGKTALGEPGVEANGIGYDEHLLAQDATGRLVVVSPGIFPWLLRLIGGETHGRTYLEGTDTVRCSMNVTAGRHDLVFYVSPLSDDVVDYTAPNVSLRLPSPSLLQAGVCVVALWVGGVITYSLGAGVGTGLAAVGSLFLPSFVDVHAENAVIDPAPPHFADAHANSMVLAANYDAVRTVDDAKDKLAESEARRNVAVLDADEERAVTLVEETLGAEHDDEGDLRNVVDLDEELLDRLQNGEKRPSDDKGVTFADD